VSLQRKVVVMFRRRFLVSLFFTMLVVGTLISIVPAAQATFPGENGKIAFAGNQTGDYEIYSINPDGTGLTRLTDFPGFNDVWPAWSPDGKRIAFSTRRPPESREIYVMNADGSGLTRLTNNTAIDSVPSWSPDGEKILFISDRDDPNFEIYVMDADGSDQTRLTNDPGAHFIARFHPDGDKIVFERAEDDGTEGPYAVYTMRPDGTRIRKLTEDSMQAGAPDWSPDGEVVFVDSFCTNCPGSDVFVMNAAGRNIRQRTDNFGNNLWPHFSPNGRKITFTHEDGPPFDFTDEEIYTMNADGTGRVNLTNTPDANEFGSDWQPVAENDDDD
jgi:Tol biopolymer transport system component